MIPLEEARAAVLAGVVPLPPRPVPIDQALGRVAAETVTAPEAVPPFDNTAMDGYAVRAADTATVPARLAVVATLAAGSAPDQPVGEGQAVRIMTGAPMPPGADAVVMVERTVPRDEGAAVEVQEAVVAGQHVRSAGDDLRAGDVVVEAGTVLTAGHLGLLASVGVTEVVAHPPARVGVLSTGDELVEGGGPLAPGQVRDANRPTLLALVGQAGAVAVDLGRVGDDEAALTGVMARGAASCDALVTSGGVSVGDFDLVRTVLDRLGDMVWMQVAVKPAKPLAVGTIEGTPVFGLPGNPVSSMVSFELFARPALRRLMGHRVLDRPRALAVADHRLGRSPDGKVHLVRVVARWGEDGRVHVRSAGAQGSHQLTAMAAANALAVLPDGEGAEAGDPVTALLLDTPT